MVHAGVLEGELTKDDILTLYLTLAPYGGNIEGIRAATLAYFGKETGRLTTAEAALLVQSDRAVAFAMDDILLYGLRAAAPNPAELAVVGEAGVVMTHRPSEGEVRGTWWGSSCKQQASAPGCGTLA